MTAIDTHRPSGEIAEMVMVVLRGAEVNQRPDLAGRLRTAAQQLTAAPGPAAEAGAAEAVVRSLRSLQVDLRVRRRELADLGRRPRLEAETLHAQQGLEEFRGLAEAWPQVLVDAMASVGADAEFDLRARMRAVVEEGTSAEASGYRLAEGLAREAGQCLARLEEAFRAVATRIAGGLDLPAGERIKMPAPIGVDPARLVEEILAGRALAGSRAPLSSQVLGVVMPTYGGTMMALVGPRLLGLHLPALVLGVAAAGGALCMGGAALAAERQRQRTRRAGEAANAVRAASEAVHLALAKIVRDGVRTAGAQLRRAIGDAVDRQGRRLAGQAGALRRQVEELQRGEDSIQALTDDLGVVDQLLRRAEVITGRRSELPDLRPDLALPAVAR